MKATELPEAERRRVLNQFRENLKLSNQNMVVEYPVKIGLREGYLEVAENGTAEFKPREG